MQSMRVFAGRDQLESASASCAIVCINEDAVTASSIPGGGLPSSCESVSKSATRFCMRLACEDMRREIAFAFGFLQRQILHRFHKAGQYRERRADFMRDVCHKIAPHRLGLLDGRHIARDEKFAAFAKRVNLNRDTLGARGRLLLGIDDDFAVEILAMKVVDEGRVADQIHDRLQLVALGVDAELFGSRLVAPIDAIAFIEDHHAVGRGLDGGKEKP